MQQLKEKLALRKIEKAAVGPKSERAFVIGLFLDHLNPSRVSGGYKPLTAARVGMMVSHLSISDLYAFLKQCENYNGPFSKAFFGALKVRPSDK